MVLNKTDEIFKKMIAEIMENGFSNEGQEVRPKWEDGTPAYTKKLFCVVNRYNLSEGLPILTLRKTNWKAALDEILWIWQLKSNKVADLNSHIWDAWAKDGNIGKAYGYQLGKLDIYTDVTEEGLAKAFGEVPIQDYKYDSAVYDKVYRNGGYYALHNKRKNAWELDQVNKVIYDLKVNPYSRRIMTNIYCFADLHEMNLYPCAYSMTFNVSGNKLNAILNQRSNDTIVANNWNVVQYALLVHMFAQVAGLEVGELVHVIADAHIYDRHFEIAEKLLARESFAPPKLVMNKNVTDFYKFTVDDFSVENYQFGESVGRIPVAE